MVLHEQLFDVAVAIGKRGFRCKVQNVKAPARSFELLMGQQFSLIDIYVQDRGLELDNWVVLVVLYLRDGATIFGLEELGVLVGVEKLALLSSIRLLLQHAKATVRDGLLEHLVLLVILAYFRLPELLYEPLVVDLLHEAGMLDAPNFPGALRQLF